jgi:hypothetical protein
MISENKMFLSIFFGLVWFGWERERRERERERECERGTEWFREFRELQQQHTNTCTLFQSCHLQRHVSKGALFFHTFIHAS